MLTEGVSFYILEYNIKPKKTFYKGTAFRSRLEARWAVFFDYMDWEWYYEPSEISGYNPDFTIKCRSNAYDTETIIVEVKPTVMITSEEKESIYNKYRKLKAHILILSDMPFSRTETGTISIGIGSQYFPGREESVLPAFYEIEMKSDNDIGSTELAFDGMICGTVARKEFLTLSFEHDLILRLWMQAGNKVQFKVKEKAV